MFGTATASLAALLVCSTLVAARPAVRNLKVRPTHSREPGAAAVRRCGRSSVYLCVCVCEERAKSGGCCVQLPFLLGRRVPVYMGRRGLAMRQHRACTSMPTPQPADNRVAVCRGAMQNLAEFNKLIKHHKENTGLPVIVDFYSDGCGPCRQVRWLSGRRCPTTMPRRRHVAGRRGPACCCCAPQVHLRRPRHGCCRAARPCLGPAH